MTTELLDLTPSSIGTNPGNPRSVVTNLDELADSIRAVGILEPLIVAPTGKGRPKWVLIAGHRRLAAAKVAGLKVVPAIARHDLTDPAAQLEHALVENLHREDLTPIEEAQAYQALLEFPGYTIAKVVAATGRSSKTVKLRLGLNRLSEETRAKVAGQQISLAEAEVLARYAKQPDVLAQLERAAGTSNFGWVAQRIKDDEKREKTRAATLATLVEQEVRVVDGFSGNQALSWLGIPADEHTTCPGHAASISYDGTRVTYVCSDPGGNGHEQAETPANRQTFHQENAASRAHADALQTAATVRNEWLTTVLAKPTTATLDALAALLVEYLIYSGTICEALALLGLTPADPAADLDDWARTTTAGWDHKRALTLVIADALSVMEPYVYSKRWDMPSVRTYMNTLVGLGYELSDVEAAQLVPADE